MVTRKLFLFGKYSLALLPPKKWLSKLGIKEGDTVGMQLDSSKRRLIVYFDSKRMEKATKTNKNNKPSKNGWEPIPRL